MIMSGRLGGIVGAALTWPPAAPPATDQDRRWYLATADARQVRGLADELAADMAAVARWARPTVAERARTVQKSLLVGPTLASPGDRADYSKVWRLAVKPPTEAVLWDPTTWDDAGLEAIEDAQASARQVTSEIAPMLGWTAAGLVALYGLHLMTRR